MPGFNQNGSLYCGRHVLTTFGHGRTLASGSRQDKRAEGEQDAIAACRPPPEGAPRLRDEAISAAGWG